jgi:hypothetical protein
VPPVWVEAGEGDAGVGKLLPAVRAVHALAAASAHVQVAIFIGLDGDLGCWLGAQLPGGAAHEHDDGGGLGGLDDGESVEGQGLVVVARGSSSSDEQGSALENL